MHHLLRIAAIVLACVSIVHARADHSGKDLSNRDLRTEDFEGANLSNAKLDMSDLRECNLKGANLRGASLLITNLTGADLSGADLRDTKLNVSLDGANLSGANLEGLDMKGTSLYGVNLRGANLRNVKGVGIVTKTDFTDADLRGAYLIGAKDYNGESTIYKGAKYDRRTRFPKGVDPERVGAVKVEEEAAPAPGPGDAPAANAPPNAPDTPKDQPAEAPKDAPADADKPAETPTEVIDPHKDPKAPALADIKAAMEKHWSQTGVKNTFRYKTIQLGAARKGEFRTDGTPAGADVTVYPVRVAAEQTVEFPDGVTRTESRDIKTVFFRDEFGEWTWRIK